MQKYIDDIDKLKVFQVLNGKNQREMGHLLGGISQSTYSRIIQRLYKPKKELQERIHNLINGF